MFGLVSPLKIMIARTVTEKSPQLTGKQAPQWLVKADTHHTLYLVAEDGRASSVAVESIPEAENFADGARVNKVSALEEGAMLADVFSVPLDPMAREGKFAISVSRFGMVKKTALAEFPGPSSQPFTFVKTNPEDMIIKVLLTDGTSDVLLVTALGMVIRFSEQDVRPMGLVAAGVNGIKLAAGDSIIGAVCLTAKEELLLVAQDGTGWRISEKEIPLQGRYGQGVRACKLKPGMELAGVLNGPKTQNGIIHYQKAASDAIRMDMIHLGKRALAGKTLVEVKDGDSVLCLTRIMDDLAFWPGDETLSPKQKINGSESGKQLSLTGLDSKTTQPKPTKKGTVVKSEKKANNPSAKTATEKPAAKPATKPASKTTKKEEKKPPAKKTKK